MEKNNGQMQVVDGADIATRELATLRRIDDSPAAIMGILAKAVENGANADVLEKLATLSIRIADRSAAQEFAQAMARFQQACPPITKNKTVSITSQSKGTTHGYTFADLTTIATTVGPLLAKEGLSYTWDSEEANGKVTCTCIIRHTNGHSVSAKFTATTDTPAAMSGAQKSASAFTYARRQSLVAALGLTTCDPDSDGAVRGGASSARITEEQAATLEVLIDDVGANKAIFLNFMGTTSLAELPASRFGQAIQALEDKRKQNARKVGGR